MLLENAIKHNFITEKKPLTVEIKEDNEYISVKNNLQKKNNIEKSNKMGLKNIIFRYKYLADKKVIINQTEEYFEVKIPILNQEI